MVGWYHRLDGHELEQAPGVGNGQGSLVCCSPWGRKESDTTEQLNCWYFLPFPGAVLKLILNVFNSILLFIPSVVSDSLQSHGLQHTRLPCPLSTPGVCSNSCPLSR